MSVNTHRTVQVGRRQGAAARAFAAVRRVPANTAPLILAAGALAYMINLREAHFSSMVQLLSGWGCVLLLFAIGRFPQTRRNAWRLVGPMHVAETREKARENVRFGLQDWLRYFQEVAALPLAPPGNVDDAVDALLKSGFAVIGDPDDAIAQLERLAQQSGGYGGFLQMAANWADFPATLKSYELFARYVMPRFQQANDARRERMEWATKNRPKFMGAMVQAIGSELAKHTNEVAARRAKKPAD